jgi:PII-like signaling protein
MNLPKQAERLRIFIGEGDRSDGKPLYEAIVQEARKAGLAGATVLRAVMGYGANSRVHSNKILRLSEDLSLVVEIVDVPEKIGAFVPLLDKIISEGLVTREPVEVIFYRHSRQQG